MDATLKSIRAIAVEFFFRIYKPVVGIAAVIFLTLIILCSWLVTVSAWWWLLFAVVLLWLFISTLFLIISLSIINAVRPEQTKQQKEQLKQFVDKIERVKEVTATPKFILLFRIVRDVYRPTEAGFIASLSDDAISLKKDFSEYRDSFLS